MPAPPNNWGDVIADAQEQSGMTNSAFVDAFAWLKYGELAQLELFRLVTGAFGDHWYAVSDVVATNGSGVLVLPSGVNAGGRILGITKDAGTPLRQTIHRYQQGNRDGRNVVITYRTFGAGIQLEPIESCAGNFRIYYQAPPTAPALVGDVIDPVLQPYRDFISTTMAIKALLKAEKPVADLVERVATLRKAILQAATTRDVSEPGRVSDVEMQPTRRLYRR